MSNGRRRLVNIVLVCSLAINLLLVGGLIGHWLRGGGPPRPIPDHLGWIIRHLDDDTRRALRPKLQSHIREAWPLRREMRDAQREFQRALTAEEFDETRLEAALTRLRSASLAWQEAMHEEMIIILKNLAPEDRQRVVSFLERHDARRRRDRPGDGPPPEGPP